MAANFGFNNLKVEAIGQNVTIPNNDVAKLMYYLSCVDTVINYNEIDRLSDYENYDLLSVDSMTELFKLVLLFNPEIFIEAVACRYLEYLVNLGIDTADDVILVVFTLFCFSDYFTELYYDRILSELAEHNKSGN